MTRVATVAVLSLIAAFVWRTPSPWQAAVSGLAATVVLVAVHLRRTPGAAGAACRTITPAALAATAVALLAATLPGTRWSPVVAPVAVVLLGISAIAPLAGLVSRRR